MQQDSAVISTSSDSSQPSQKSSRWDKKIASIGFGIALLLAIICFATLMGSNQNAKAHDVEETHPTNHR